jgi:hypothetical protein
MHTYKSKLLIKYLNRNRMDGIGLHLTSKEEREERIEELMQEISISSIENYAVEGLIRGMKIEMESIGIDRDHELYGALLDALNNYDGYNIA